MVGETTGFRGGAVCGARDVRLPTAQVVERVRAVAAAVTAEAPPTHDAMRNDGIDHPVIARLVEALVARARVCAELPDAGD